MSNGKFWFSVGTISDLVANIAGLPFAFPDKLNLLIFAAYHPDAGEGSDRVPTIVLNEDRSAYRDLTDSSRLWRNIPDGSPVSNELQQQLSAQWELRMEEVRNMLPSEYRIDLNPPPIINLFVNTHFRSSQLNASPITLDLDGDGIEITQHTGSILFDHNADGVKTGTGWAGADDGFLVRDLNGNGTIDTGRELFGVDTVKSNGQLATQGFDALADLDSNADGQITSADAAWSQLQVWRDLNQDGISQAGELSTLAGLNITRIGVNGTSTGPQAGQTINNNRVALSTTYTRAGVNRTVGAIDLQANAFFSEIPPEVVDEAGNPVTVTETAAALPQMNGSGMVRNLLAATRVGRLANCSRNCRPARKRVHAH